MAFEDQFHISNWVFPLRSPCRTLNSKVAWTQVNYFWTLFCYKSKMAHLVLSIAFGYTRGNNVQAVVLYLTHATCQNLTSNLCIFIRLEGFFFSLPLSRFTHIGFVIPTQYFLSHIQLPLKNCILSTLPSITCRLEKDRVGKRCFSSLPLCLLYFILFMICGFSFFQTASDMAKPCQLHQIELSLSLQRNLLPHLQRLNKKPSKC